MSGCQRVFSQTAWLARGRISAGCQWKVSYTVCSSHPHGLFFFCLCLFHYINMMSCFTFSDAKDKQQNPMVQLFYGTFVTERKHEGKWFVWASVMVIIRPILTSMWLCLGKPLFNIEQFGQYPLQVNGFNNLDECLEGAMVEKEIESLHSDHSVTSVREVNDLTNWLNRRFNDLAQYSVFSVFQCNLMLH